MSSLTQTKAFCNSYYHFSELMCCTTNRKVAGSIPDGDIGIFHEHNLSDRTMVPGVDSASNRNEYQENFLGVNAAGV